MSVDHVLLNFHVPQNISLLNQTFYVLISSTGADSSELESSDVKKVYSYFTDRGRQFQQLFDQLGLDIVVVEVSMSNYQAVIDTLCSDPSSNQVVFYNFCDGVEVDGLPGKSVHRYLEQLDCLRVGATYEFADISVNKAVMKEVFKQNGVSTAPFVNIYEWNETVRSQVLNLTFPVILKPSTFYASIGTHTGNVCKNIAEVEKIIQQKLSEFKVIVIEEFINGPEFTVLVMEDIEGKLFALNPAEIKFREHIPKQDRWLSFEHKWSKDGEMYYYAPCTDAKNAEAAKIIALKAFQAVKGRSYGRVDIRKNEETGEFFVLEVNENPAYGFYCSVDCILKFNGVEIERFIQLILANQRRTRVEKSAKQAESLRYSI